MKRDMHVGCDPPGYNNWNVCLLHKSTCSSWDEGVFSPPNFFFIQKGSLSFTTEFNSSLMIPDNTGRFYTIVMIQLYSEYATGFFSSPVKLYFTFFFWDIKLRTIFVSEFKWEPLQRGVAKGPDLPRKREKTFKWHWVDWIKESHYRGSILNVSSQLG